MGLFFVYIFKSIQRVSRAVLYCLDKPLTYFILKGNNVKFNSFKTSGLPLIQVSLGGKVHIGSHFSMNNRASANPIGRTQRCSISVGRMGVLEIGENVGMSSSSIVCQNHISIGSNVKLGGNVVIYDTDFHSLDPSDRTDKKKDIENAKGIPVKIGENVFIGAHATILKGVNIGNNSIVGACSVVTGNIPENEIWAGNPARLIRKIT